MRGNGSARMALRRVACAIAALAGLGSAPSIAAAQGVAATEAPAEWVAYAQEVTVAITDWLQADSDAARRFRAYVAGTRNAQSEQSSSLMLKVWVADDGTVSRIDFTPFAHAEANADLRRLIEGRRLDIAPPPDMLQPLRLMVELQVPHSGNEANAIAAGGSPNSSMRMVSDDWK